MGCRGLLAIKALVWMLAQTRHSWPPVQRKDVLTSRRSPPGVWVSALNCEQIILFVPGQISQQDINRTVIHARRKGKESPGYPCNRGPGVVVPSSMSRRALTKAQREETPLPFTAAWQQAPGLATPTLSQGRGEKEAEKGMNRPF